MLGGCSVCLGGVESMAPDLRYTRSVLQAHAHKKESETLSISNELHCFSFHYRCDKAKFSW